MGGAIEPAGKEPEARIAGGGFSAYGTKGLRLLRGPEQASDLRMTYEKGPDMVSRFPC